MTVLVTKHLPLVAGAPDGIKNLRALILDLAIRAKLVPQNPADTPAIELLVAASEARAQKKNARKAGAEFDRSSVDGTQLAALPKAWVWTTLSDVAQINPRNSLEDNVKVSFVPMAMIGTRFDSGHEHELRPWGEVKQGFTHFAEGDIGVAKITPCFENSKACVFSGLSNGFGAGTTELHVVRPLAKTLAPRYVLAYLKSPWFLSIGETKMTGTAGQKRLPKDFVERHPFPLPPLAEQHRIVAKVDELMALCDRLEADQADAEVAHAQLVQALLDSLTQATDAADFRANWQRLSEHFHTLFTTEASIDALKQTVLQLAMMGKLTGCAPTQSTGHGVLAKPNLEAPKNSLTGTDFEANSPQSRAIFKLPTEWRWVSLSNVIASFTNGLYKAAEHYTEDGLISLRMFNIQEGDIDLSTVRRVRVTDAEIAQYGLREGDILINRVNSKELVGKAAVVPASNQTMLFESMNMRARPRLDLVNPRFVCFWLRTSWARAFLSSSAKEAISQASINQSQVGSIPLPLPPLAEQHRIVVKVDELMALCDQLKAQLAEARQQHAQFATALVEQAVT